MTLPDPEASRAVLIGSATYAPDSGYESFAEVARSLADFAEFLRAETGLRHIDVIADPADNAEIAAAITAAAKAATGLLLVYYVGHGAVVDNQLHLTHKGSRADDADVTALGYGTIRSRIKKDARGPVVVILDCCHSGKAFSRDVLSGDSELLVAATDIDGAFVLTATDEKSKFALAKGEHGSTAFTGMLLDILRTGVPTGDRLLTMSVLYRELRDRLPAANLPRPKALERGTAGQLALAANRRWSGGLAAEGLPPVTATAYTAQVRDLTPIDGLLDRDAELAELAEFCSGDEPYVWWQAGPWAGKTALMTWFALHPPPGVRVISFFVTSRLAAHDDHNAFTDAVLEQLSALLPDQVATVARGSTDRDALRRHLLELAAQRAADSGGRVVLLVDGLDEDRGKPSIASLLPKYPHPGLRVLVSGRPHPDLPLDVPRSHPLNSCRRRELGRSLAAFDIIQMARLELHGILERSDVDQQILGLITAAHGLTGTELEDLTGLPPYRIDTILAGVTGRTFQPRSNRFAPGQIYLLAHETLQREAESALGRALMTLYRNRIHTWAARYRDQGWPVETPTYLLTRYFSMLRGQNDRARMTELALDIVRHDRMLVLTGGDGMARTEITTVSGVWAAAKDPDLLAVCKLAMRRRRLTRRGGDIPAGLPAALALMGETTRAQSLADGIPRSGRRRSAQIELIAVRVAAGDARGNRALIDSLRSDRYALSDHDLVRLTAALVRVGDIAGAQVLGREIALPVERTRMLAQLVSSRRLPPEDVAEAIREINRHALLTKGPSLEREDILRRAAGAFADIGDFDRALALSETLTTEELRAATRCRIARAMTEHGQTEAAGRCVRSVLTAIRGMTFDPVMRSRLLAWIAADLVAVGRQDRLREHLDDLEARLTGYTRLVRLAMVEQLVHCRSELGDADRAVTLGRRFATETDGLAIWTSTLPALVRAGRTTEARRLAAEIELISYQVSDPYERGFEFFAVVRALLVAGDVAHAEAMAERIDDIGCQFLVCAFLGTRPAGTTERASAYLDRAHGIAEALLARVHIWDDKAAKHFGRTLFAADWLGRHPVGPAQTPLAALLDRLIARGSLEAAVRLADRLVSLYSTWPRPHEGLDQGLGGLAAVFVRSGHDEIARTLIYRVGGLASRIAVARVVIGEVGVQAAEVLLRPMLDEFEKDVLAGGFVEVSSNRADLVRLSVTLGDSDRAQRLSNGGGPAGIYGARAASVPAAAEREAREHNADALIRVYRGLPAADRPAANLRIRRLLAEILAKTRWYEALDMIARFDPALLAAIAEEAVRLDAEPGMAHQINAI
ncbi:hypothetical protein [Nocardia sp. NBC_00511]|uniref:caspase, EACC1-associated type n=1 Tax=Nocardia sp. NBC_00511 TaxID=2903591 RepID=UPI0030DEA9C8